MKKTINYLMLLAVTASLFITSCTTVDSGHQGVIVSWGGETDTTTTLDEGMHFGFRYITDDAIEYEVREQTVSVTSEINDKNDMVTPIEVTVYYAPIKTQVNKLHKEFGTGYAETKLTPILKASLAKIVPQYNATELNKTKRAEAEHLLSQTIVSESKTMFVDIKRVQLGKVGIPDQVAKLAEETAVQEGRNLLAAKREEEQIQLAKAKRAEAQGNYDAGVLNAKTKDLLSQPKMLELQKLENERIMWEGFAKTGKSPFGENNVYNGGTNPTTMLLNRK